MCQNVFGQSDYRILQSAISQEKSFVCKLTSTFPTRKYYCVDMGDHACLKYLKEQVCTILVTEIDIFYCRISQGSTC